MEIPFQSPEFCNFWSFFTYVGLLYFLTLLYTSLNSLKFFHLDSNFDLYQKIPIPNMETQTQAPYFCNSLKELCILKCKPGNFAETIVIVTLSFPQNVNGHKRLDGRISLRSVLLLVNFVSGYRLELMNASQSSPWFSASWVAAIVHRNHFFCLHQKDKSSASKSKVQTGK